MMDLLEKVYGILNFAENHKLGHWQGKHSFQWRGNTTSGINLGIVSIIHGNEFGGLYLFYNLAKFFISLNEKSYFPAVSVKFIFGHTQAFKENKRFLERDLNRCFSEIDFNEDTSMEWKIAIRVKQDLMNCNYILDLHQTQGESDSDFFIYPETKNNVVFQRCLNLKAPVVLHDLSFSLDGDTVDTWASQVGKTAITYEMGGLNGGEEQIRKIFNSLKDIILGPSDRDIFHNLKYCKVEYDFFTWGDTILKDSFLELVPGLKNFSILKPNDDFLLNKRTGIVTKHKEGGIVLFPKYGKQRESSSELCRLLKPIRIF